MQARPRPPEIVLGCGELTYRQNLVCNGSHGISVGSLGQYPGTYDIVEDVYVYNISMSNASVSLPPLPPPPPRTNSANTPRTARESKSGPVFNRRSRAIFKEEAAAAT